MPRKLGLTAFFAAAAILSLIVIQPADAGNCYAYQGAAYTYAQPSYQQAYSYAPSYQYQTKYVYHDVQYPVPVKAVLSPDFYFGAADTYQVQAKAQQDSLVADAAAFRALSVLANLNRAPGVQPGASVPAPYDPRTPAPQLRNPAPPKNTALPQAGVPAGLQAVVDAKCISCHQSGGKNLPDLSDLSSVSKVDRLSCWQQTFDATMPKGKNPLSDAETNLFKNWAIAAKR